VQIHGFHHLTAVSARIAENHRFYTRVLGMRLVKRSVNQDDVSAYHLFYADGVGTPGTDLTFFDWPVGPERRGTHAVTRTFLRVLDGESVAWWKTRLAEQGVATGEVEERDGRATLLFEDGEGQRLGVVADDGWGDPPTPWDASPVPPRHQIRGLGPILISVPDPDPTDRVLVSALGMKAVRRYRGANGEGPEADVIVYAMAGEGPHTELHVAVEPHLHPTRPGAGGVHHVAFRVHDDAYDAWAAHLNRLGIPNSGAVDRYYFRSLYFREPNGILFELATDGPGFGVDEEMATLGEQVVLPPFLEPRRAEIMAGLKPID